jgi:hypothetical protein
MSKKRKQPSPVNQEENKQKRNFDAFSRVPKVPGDDKQRLRMQIAQVQKAERVKLLEAVDTFFQDNFYPWVNLLKNTRIEEDFQCSEIIPSIKNYNLLSLQLTTSLKVPGAPKDMTFSLSSQVNTHEHTYYGKEDLSKLTSPSLYDVFLDNYGIVMGHETIENICFRALDFELVGDRDYDAYHEEYDRTKELFELKHPFLWELLDPGNLQDLQGDVLEQIWNKLPWDNEHQDFNEKGDQQWISCVREFVEMFLLIVLCHSAPSCVAKEVKEAAKKSQTAIALRHSLKCCFSPIERKRYKSALEESLSRLQEKKVDADAQDAKMPYMHDVLPLHSSVRVDLPDPNPDNSDNSKNSKNSNTEEGQMKRFECKVISRSLVECQVDYPRFAYTAREEQCVVVLAHNSEFFEKICYVKSVFNCK